MQIYEQVTGPAARLEMQCLTFDSFPQQGEKFCSLLLPSSPFTPLLLGDFRLVNMHSTSFQRTYITPFSTWPTSRGVRPGFVIGFGTMAVHSYASTSGYSLQAKKLPINIGSAPEEDHRDGRLRPNTFIP